eukprot:3364292-Amphidinium_carterae.1
MALPGCGHAVDLLHLEPIVRKWRTSPTSYYLILSCPHWHKERCQVELPADDATVPTCAKLHGLLPALRAPPVIYHEPELVHHVGVHTVWTDAS